MRTKALRCGMAHIKELHEFAIKFRERRIAFGFTQQQLADEAKCSRRTIVSAERAEKKSKVNPIGVRTAFRIAEVLALKADSLAQKRVVALVPPPAKRGLP